MDVEEVAGELYGLLPEEFISTRTLREKEAKAAGDKALAAQIHALAKPNQVGWLANQLSRRHASEITPLLELGAELRDAEGALSPHQLQEFSRQQRQLVGALVRQAKQLAYGLGKKVSDDTAQGLQETLQAALADSDAAEQLMRGCLVEGMQHVGFGPGSVMPGARPPTASAKSEAPAGDRQPATLKKPDRHERDLERADRDVERAEALARDALEMRDDAESELATATQEQTELEEQVARLRDELEQSEAALARAQRDQRRLRTALERAEKAADDAVRRLQRAQQARQRLTDDG